MAKILEFKPPKEEMTDEMLSVDQWDGSAWKEVFEKAFVPMSKEMGCTPWDCLAGFVRGLLIGEEDNR